ncbi:NYN domain-containing protein [Ferruginibacter sp.]|nr:NYN domain-containing protein [Ferruginibacter sp.]
MASTFQGITRTGVSENNWAFVDMQNLHKGVQEKGWAIKWKCFRQFLKDNYNVTRAVAFMGYIKEYQALYTHIRNPGFTLEFRQVKRLNNGTIEGGNVDADLASYVMDYKNEYHKAIIVADDGDYCRTVKSLDRQNKLKLIISSHSMKNTSELIKQAVGCKSILSIHSIRNQVS